jgi:spore coat protein CotH
LTFDVVMEAGGIAPRTAFAEISVNGVYHGFYLLIERVEDTFIDVPFLCMIFTIVLFLFVISFGAFYL